MKRLVAVVDDDISVRESLEGLIRSVGLAATVFGSAEEFLNSGHPREADCLILDVRLPGMNGFKLHRSLTARGDKVPAVFISAHGFDDRTKLEAVPDWTVAYLTKPFDEDELLDAVQTAFTWKPNGRVTEGN
jgi:FixJ family two-component response regulator